MKTYRTIGLILLGAALGAGVVATGYSVRAQGLKESQRITVTPIEWTDGVPFRYVRDARTLKCYFAALHTRDMSITAMVEAPGPCQ
jgi:hypothetical protein